jgi:hypothetical protein
MAILQNLGAYLYRKQLIWTECVFLFLIGIAIFSFNLKEVDFYVDENPWIYESAALNSFLEGDFASELWEDDYNGMLDPPMAKYLIGFGINLSGLSIESLPRWDWNLDYQENIDRGCIPSDTILWWARIPMVITSVTGLLLAAYLVSRAHSRMAAFVFYGFSLTHFTYPLRQAMSEAPLVFFTFLAGLAGYQGILALSDKKYKPTFVWFSVFGMLTGLAAASKLNAIAILLAGILGMGFVLFWRRTGELKQGLKFVLRLILVQAYLTVITFILINPYLYPSPFRKIVLMFIARSFTLQVQMKMYPQSVVMAGNWLQILPERIFGQLSTPSYPGHNVINILLFCLGVYVLVRLLWNKFPGWEAALVLGAFSLVLAVPGVISPLDWNRYYLFPVIFVRVYIAIGLAKIFSVFFNKWVGKNGLRISSRGTRFSQEKEMNHAPNPFQR